MSGIWRTLKPHMHTIAVLLSFYMISMFILRRILLIKGMIGLRHDWTVGPYSWQLQFWAIEAFYAWSPQQLGFAQLYPSNYLFKLLLGSFSFVGFSNGILFKGYLLFIISFAGISMYFLTQVLKLSKPSGFMAGFFYMITPVVFNRMVAGHLGYMFAYSLSPLIFAVYKKITSSVAFQWKWVLACGILCSLAGTSVQILIMIFAVMFAYCFTMNWKMTIKRMLSLFAVLGIVFLIHSCWVSPLLTKLGTVYQLVRGAATLADISSQSLTIPNSIRLIGYRSDHFLNAIQTMSIENLWIPISFLIPVFAFSALLLRRKSKIALYASLLAAVALLLTTGSLFTFLQSKFPFVSIFRELYHITFLIALAYALLLGIAFESIAKRLDRLSIKAIRKGSKKKAKEILKKTLIVAIFFVVIISAYSYPILTGDFAGELQTYGLGEEYERICNDLLHQEGDFRVIWTPMLSPGRYQELKYAHGIDPLIILSPKSSLGGQPRIDTLGGRYTLFLAYTLQENRTKYLGNLMGYTGVKFLMHRNDFRCEYPNYVYMNLYPNLKCKWTNEVTRKVLNMQIDVALDGKIGNITLYTNKHYFPHIYVEFYPIFAVGDLSALNSLSYVNSFGAVFLPFEHPSVSKVLSYIDTLILTNNNYFDYVSIFIPKEYKIDPGNYAICHNDARKGWINAKNWWWYNWHITTTLNNGVLTETSDELNIPVSIVNPGQYEVLAKVWYGQEGGALRFSINGTKIGRIETFSTQVHGFRWVRFPVVNLKQGNSILTLENEVGNNIVEKIILAPSEVIQSAISQATNLLSTKNVIYLWEAEETFEQLSDCVVKNPSFEEGWNSLSNAPYHWSTPHQHFSDSLDPTVKYHGLFSYRLTTAMTRENAPLGWSGVRGDEILVMPSQTYKINGYMKIENAKYSHIAIEAYNETSNKWFQLPRPPSQSGTSDWTQISFVVNIPPNVTKIRPLLNAGWVSNPQEGNATTWFDSIEIYPIISISSKYGGEASNGEVLELNPYSVALGNLSITKPGNYTPTLRAKGCFLLNIDNHTFEVNTTKLAWLHLEPIYLTKGDHKVEIRTHQNADLDVFLLYPTESQRLVDAFSPKENQGVIINYTQINPTRYEIKVNNSVGSFYLIFSETYDHDWKALVDVEGELSEEYHFIVNGFANAWYINKTGSFTITLEYIPQRLYDFGLKVSFLTIAILIVFIAIPTSKLAKLRNLLKKDVMWCSTLQRSIS